MSKENILLISKLIHSLRSELTVLNFEASEGNKSIGIKRITKLLKRFEIFYNCYDSDIDRSQKVDICELVNQVISDHFESQKSRIYFTPKKVKAWGNRLEIEYLVKELLSNALTYSKKTVFLSIHATNTKAVLRVEDFGRGIDNNVEKNIPYPFFVSSDPNSGHGLGLAIIEAVVKASKGSYKIIAEKGKGTVVIVSLNLVENLNISAE